MGVLYFCWQSIYNLLWLYFHLAVAKGRGWLLIVSYLMTFFSPRLVHHILYFFFNLTLAGFFFSRASSKKKLISPHFFQQAKVVLLITGLSFMISPRTPITVGNRKLSFEFLLPCLWLLQSSLSVIYDSWKQLYLLDGTPVHAHQLWDSPACPGIPPGLARQHSAPQFNLNFIDQ